MPESAASAIEFVARPPRRYKASAILMVHAYGILLTIPVLAAVLVMSFTPMGVTGALLLPLAAVLLTICFLPLGMGNPHIRRLVHATSPGAASGKPGFIVQITFEPRLRGGLRALIEDADDVGFLSLEPEQLRFEGDAVNFSIPYGQLGSALPQNVGWRGLFVYGRRIDVAVTGVPGLRSLQIAERDSLFLPGSKRRTGQLRRALGKTITQT